MWAIMTLSGRRESSDKSGLKVVGGMWLKCGAAGRERHSDAGRCLRVKNGLNAGIAVDAAPRKISGLLLTTTGARPYNSLHTARCPLTAQRRAFEAPHLRVGQGLREVVGGSSFVGFLVRWEEGLAGPGLFDR